jgi:hypothetical protein
MDITSPPPSLCTTGLKFKSHSSLPSSHCLRHSHSLHSVTSHSYHFSIYTPVSLLASLVLRHSSPMTSFEHLLGGGDDRRLGSSSAVATNTNNTRLQLSSSK